MLFKSLAAVRWIVAALCAALLAAGPGHAQQPAKSAPGGALPVMLPKAAGIWIDHTGRGAVEIMPCADALCGRIVWLKEPNDKSGRPLRDTNNEDRSKRKHTICGLQIIGDARRQADGSWDRGWIYDPEQGERFDLELRLRGPDLLQVTGYRGFKFLSETYQWRRAHTPPEPRCPVDQG